MNKFRVFQNVKRKRAVSGFSIRNLGTVLLLLLLLPYIITFFFGNLWEESEEEAVAAMVNEQIGNGRFYVINQTSLGDEKIPLEVYVADKLSRISDESWEKEALKAQAVLIRTNLLQEDETAVYTRDENYGQEKIRADCLSAAAETKGMYLVRQEKPVEAAYFRVSNGATRNAGEVFEEEDFPYLKSVLCSRDFLSPDYNSSVSYSYSQFENIWNKIPDDTQKPDREKVKTEELSEFTICRDSVGYVTYIGHNEKWVTGEQFRYSYGLQSASFHIKEEEEELIITVKGVGHGLGMSQFGAVEMAKEGASFIEIINYFFNDVTMTKIE